jgi:hypothetical protein
MSDEAAKSVLLDPQRTTDEPWVNLATGRDLKDWTHAEEVSYNQANRQMEKHLFFVRCFDFIKDNRIVGDYHEFGCHRVRTFRMALTEARFRELTNEHGIYTDRIETIKGFYSDSLTSGLQRKFLDQENKIALVNIDCDLYESAVPVFRFIEPLLQEGAVLYIDDLFAGYKGSPEKGVAKAFREFRQRSRFKFQRHLDIGWWGRSYIAYIGDEGSADGL